MPYPVIRDILTLKGLTFVPQSCNFYWVRTVRINAFRFCIMRNIKLAFHLVCGVLLVSGVASHASEDRIDGRLQHVAIDNRISAPRLELQALTEDEEKEVVSVSEKRPSRATTSERVTKATLQRQNKTRRVVAGQ